MSLFTETPVVTQKMLAVAEAFFDPCETGQGWQACKQFCTSNATFSAQSEPLLEITTLEQYADWMKGMLTVLPDARYELKAFAADPERNSVVAYAVFHGTHTGPGAPLPPTGKSTSTDYVYIMQFADDRITHMTKVWNSGYALKQLGWA